MTLHPDGRLEIRSPLRTTEEQVHAFLKSKSEWIRRKHTQTAAMTLVSRARQDPESDAAFRSLASALVERFAAALTPSGAGPSMPLRLSFRSQRSRWGSCSAKKAISLNYACARLPLELLEYIAAHEACHLVLMDHSPAFRGLMRSLIPDADLRRKKLAAYRLA
jgi:predicted metal-dependent hydrolase